MTCVFPFYSGDVKALTRLLKWIKQLEGCKGHDALLVADADTSWDDCTALLSLAQQSFDAVEIIATDDSVEGWPQGPNNLFLNAAEHCSASDTIKAWYWCEPDCVPLRPRWLDIIASEYEPLPKGSYLGAVMKSEDGKGFEQLAGVAVYPKNAIKAMGMLVSDGEAFDMTTAKATVPISYRSKRIQHFWGQPGISPTFATAKSPGSPPNTFTLDDINEGAVLFHRSKDGTLIRLLWQKLYPQSAPTADLLLVIPFWNGDAPATIDLLKWMGELDKQIPFDVLLTYDKSTLRKWALDAEAVARRHFRNVYMLERPAPPSTSWPIGPNFSFFTTAIHIHKSHQRPWFWFEPDAIPLKPRWLDVVSREYDLCGMPYFGPVVKQYGHMNGVAVYPSDFPVRCPNTLKDLHTAFDHNMKFEMMHECCDAGEIIQHIWGVENGQPTMFGGTCPTFTDDRQLSWLKKSAVVMHRCKDGSLIRMLRKHRL